VRIKAFSALRPPEALVQRVAAVPYDTVDTQEARVLADGNPMSLLRISRPEIDCPPGTAMDSDAVYNKAVENFAAFKREGYLKPDTRPGLFVYRQCMGGHVQQGVVACCHIDDYEQNIIRKHERTRQDKEDDRKRHTRMLRAQTGPVFLFYRDQAGIDRQVAAAQQQTPLYDFTAADGVAHTVWRIPDTASLIDLFAQVPLAYIADGHHRAAASVKTGLELRAANPHHNGREEYNWFMAVLFPGSQLKILPYNRVIADLNGRSLDAFLEEVGRRFSLTPDAKPQPAGPRQVSMYLNGMWYGLAWNETTAGIAGLDVSVLQDRLLDPVLGIRNPRTDKRIDFVGGIRGTDELVARVDSGAASVAFSMYPVVIEQIMEVSDADQIMPPKSTWFEPKLRSGLLLHEF
jgi:uncharacterized protein (DUF1015 family)